MKSPHSIDGLCQAVLIGKRLHVVAEVAIQHGHQELLAFLLCHLCLVHSVDEVVEEDAEVVIPF